MDDDQLAEIVDAYRDGRESTHWEGCHLAHPGCAVQVLADEVESLNGRVATLESQHEEDVSRLMLAGHQLGRLENGIRRHRDHVLADGYGGRRPVEAGWVHEQDLWALLDSDPGGEPNETDHLAAHPRTCRAAPIPGVQDAALREDVVNVYGYCRCGEMVERDDYPEHVLTCPSHEAANDE